MTDSWSVGVANAVPVEDGNETKKDALEVNPARLWAVWRVSLSAWRCPTSRARPAAGTSIRVFGLHWLSITVRSEIHNPTPWKICSKQFVSEIHLKIT